MYPVLYSPTETNFTTQGLGVLSDAISAIVEEERNGGFELSIKYPADGVHFAEVQHSCIIKAKVHDNALPQLFRVYKVTSPINKICTICAEHVSYQLNYIPVMPFTAYDINSAFAGLASNMTEANPFTFWTDIQSSAVYEQTEPEVARARLGGQEGSFLDVYGGEYEWDNFTVKLHQQRGMDRDVTLRYGKNITDITQEESIAATYTGVTPYWIGEVIDDDAKAYLESMIESLEESIEQLTEEIATQETRVRNAKTAYNNAVTKYGKKSAKAKQKKKAWEDQKNILAQDKMAKERAETSLDWAREQLQSVEGTRFTMIVSLPEHTLYAEDAESFPFQRVRCLDLSDKFEEKPTVEALRSMAQAWMDANDFGEPKVSLTVSFVALWDTEEYKDIAPLERVQLCDTVVIEFERLGIRVAAKVTAYKYDVILERYESITLGDTKQNIADTISDNKQIMNDVISQVPTTSMMQAEIERATKLINGGYGGYVVYTPNADGQPQEILIMDTPDVSTATKVIRMNQNGIGFSVNGYEGPYFTAWTIDGHFVADYITAGTLNASVIHAGILTDYHNATWQATTDTTVDVNKTYYVRMNTGTTQSPKYVYRVVSDPVGNPQALGYYECIHPANTNFWNLETGEFQLMSTVKVDNTTLAGAMTSAANSEVKSYDTSLNQEAVFKKLTQNGTKQGIALGNDGNLYINATYINSGTLKGITIISAPKGIIGFRAYLDPGEFKITEEYPNTGAVFNHFNIECHQDNATVGWARTVLTASGRLFLESNKTGEWGGVRSSTIFNHTTGGAANMRIGTDASGSHYQEIMQSTGSSRRFKHDIQPIDDPGLDPHKLYDVEVIQFVYNADYLDSDDQRFGENIPGFIAEQVAEAYPIGAEINKDGTVDDWNFRYIIPPMLALIQEQHKEIEDLKTEVAELKVQMQRILAKIGE